MTTVILKPTDGCNARCRYCSAAHAGVAKRMDLETVRAAFQLFGDWALRRGRRRLCLIWHGGEPLLMPTTFWEGVLRLDAELLGARGVAVDHRIQSNLTLLDAELVPLLRRLLGPRGVVGTSADLQPGIRELKGRPDGEYAARWEASLALLREAGIRYGIIYVVHGKSLDALPAVYRHFRRAHPHAGLRFNPLYRQGRARDGATWDDLGIGAEEWGGALETLHRAWVDDGCPENVQPFAPLRQLATTGRWRLSCECSGRCVESHFGISPEGHVFLCGRSADGESFRFGEVGALTVDDLETHPLRRQLRNRATYLRRTTCRSCRWWPFCHGGCINDAVLAAETPFAPTSWCAGLRRYFETAFGDGAEERRLCSSA